MQRSPCVTTFLFVGIGYVKGSMNDIVGRLKKGEG